MILQRPILLVSDIDQTLMGNDDALSRLCELLSASGEACRLVLATGRSLESVIRLVESGALPSPKAIISAVGSEIHYAPDWDIDPVWAEQMAAGWQRDNLVECLASIAGVRPQDDAQQRPFKLSYLVEDMAAVRAAFEKVQQSALSCSLICSHGNLLDILPSAASKGAAVQHLLRIWKVPEDLIVVCGDSGNDLEMLEKATQGIVVSNYEPALDVLRNRPTVFFARQSCAAGIIEGLTHFGFIG